MSNLSRSQTRRLREIEAGKHVLAGSSFKQGLLKAGFAESTARTPKAHGLDAKECVKLALAEESEVPTATLRTNGRKLLDLRLRDELNGTADRPSSTLAAAKVVDVIEKIGKYTEDTAGLQPRRSQQDRLGMMAWAILDIERQTGRSRILIVAEQIPDRTTAEQVLAAAEQMVAGVHPLAVEANTDGPDSQSDAERGQRG